MKISTIFFIAIFFIPTSKTSVEDPQVRRSTEEELSSVYSTGIILDASVEPFEVDGLKDCTIVTNIQNIGNATTDYIVTVNCSTLESLLYEIPAQMRTLSPGEKKKVQSMVFSNLTLQSSNRCLCSLRSSMDEVYDSVTVIFDGKLHRSNFSRDNQDFGNDDIIQEDSSGRINFSLFLRFDFIFTLLGVFL